METEKDIGAEIIEKLEELNSNLDEIILRAKNKEESKNPLQTRTDAQNPPRGKKR